MRGMAVSRSQKFFNLYARYVQKPSLTLVRPQWLLRGLADWTGWAMARRPKGMAQRDEAIADVSCHWMDCGGETARGVLLYLHGEAFVIGKLGTYAHVVSRMADQAGMAGLFVDYRLAPEDPFPAAPEDCFSVYKALLERGVEPGRIAVVGDSAGGNLALVLLHQARAAGLPMPGAVALMSPSVDCAGSPSMELNRRSEILLSPRWGRQAIEAYLDGEDVANPLVSPIHGQFEGAPPVLFQVAAGEMLYDDTYRMAEVLRGQGVQVRVDEWQGVPHVWHLNAGWTPEADKGVADIAAFLREVIGD